MVCGSECEIRVDITTDPSGLVTRGEKAYFYKLIIDVFSFIYYFNYILQKKADYDLVR